MPVDYHGLPEPPEQAAADSWDVYCQLFPQRNAPWDELAEWERGRWRIVLAAGRKRVPGEARPLGQGDVIK